jgi:Transposase DDE domain
MSIDCDSLLELEKQARQQSHGGGQEPWFETQQLEKQDSRSLRWSEEALTQSRRLLLDKSFCHQHRINQKAFTRQRHFTFANSMLFLMQKTLRSIQRHIHSFFDALGQPSPGLTPSAWSRARKKLSYKAFITLNEEAILKVVYRDRTHPQLRLWKDFRLIAIDSSLVRLPNEEALGTEFGWVECQNKSGDCGRYPQARLSALTDVLNRIAIQTSFEPWTKGERELAQEQIQFLQAGDLGLLDRGYAEYKLWACLVLASRQFLCRCQANTFAIVIRLFKENQADRSEVVELVPHREQMKEIQDAHLPTSIKLRFVTVRLKTGELEVLATNLLDEVLYPTECFGELYHWRWVIETYYGLLKGRLDLGHFTGLSAEAIRQDVFSTIFVSNLESLLIAPANQQLEQKSQSLEYRQQVNHAVSFHTIKTRVIDLLIGPDTIAQVVEKLEPYFLANPVLVRPDRIVPRNKPSAWKSYNYQRNVRKAVF